MDVTPLEKPNWQAANDVITKAQLPDRVDARCIKECVAAAHDKWFASDIASLTILSLEQEVETTLDLGYQNDPHTVPKFAKFKYVLDMLATAKQEIPKTPIKGQQVVIVDYKTSALDLSTPYGKNKFRETYTNSKQHTYYAAVCPEARWFWYRGVSKQHGGGTCDLILPIRESELLADDMRTTLEARNRLVDRRDAWWYRNFDACKDYGQQCPYFQQCRILNIPEIGKLEVPAHLSHSQISSFWACPERYKRDRLVVGGEKEGTDASQFGTVFHAAMHALYTS